MSSEIDDEKGLLFDIRYALRKAPVCRSRDERSSDRWRDLVAGYVLDYLKLSNWIIRKGEPLNHIGSTAPPMDQKREG
jgi:hypothetical protein